MFNPFANRANVVVELRSADSPDATNCKTYIVTADRECREFAAFAVFAGRSAVFHSCGKHLTETVITAARYETEQAAEDIAKS